MDVYFDSNIWFEMGKISAYSRETSNCFKQLDFVLKDAGVYVSFTGINFWEWLLGLNENNFKEEQAKLQYIHSFTNSRFLSKPEQYAQIDFHNRFSELDLQFDNYWIECTNRFASAGTYKEVEVEKRNLSKFVKQYKAYWAEFINQNNIKIRNLLREKFGIVNRVDLDKLYHSEEFRSSLIHSYLKYYLKRYKIEPKWTEVNVFDAFRFLHGFRAFCAIYEAYNLRLLKKDNSWVHARENDYFDLEQLIYLDEMDYFVTEEKKLWTLFDVLPSCPLSGKVISMSEFLNKLS